MRAVDHFVEAEHCLTAAQAAEADDDDRDRARLNLEYAAVHATLALAGATALASYVRTDAAELTDWETAAGGDR